MQISMRRFNIAARQEMPLIFDLNSTNRSYVKEDQARLNTPVPPQSVFLARNLPGGSGDYAQGRYNVRPGVNVFEN